MHIWTLDKWEKFYNISDSKHRTGARLKFDKDVDPEVKRACKEFLIWLRKEYFFPIRVPIYVKAAEQIKAKDGEMVSGTCFLPFDMHKEPYIRISAGDYYELKNKRGKDNALAAILGSIAHELTHYFQWVNGLEYTLIGEERQATQYVRYILYEYAETREHP